MRSFKIKSLFVSGVAFWKKLLTNWLLKLIFDSGDFFHNLLIINKLIYGDT